MISINEEMNLKPLLSEDTDFILKLVNSNSWLKFVGERYIFNENDALDYISKIKLKQHEKLHLGYLKVENKDGQSIGIVGMLQRDYLSEPDLGFAFLPEFEGKGLAYVANQKFLKWYFELEKSINQLAAIVQSNNERSIRLLERLGFMHNRRILEQKENLELYYLKRP
jgi:RimJ/RimL family protein N-acetyltransferase